MSRTHMFWVRDMNVGPGRGFFFCGL